MEVGTVHGVTARLIAALYVATMAENRGADQQPHQQAAMHFPCTMTQLFMHAVKQDATHLLFTALACHILQSTNA